MKILICTDGHPFAEEAVRFGGTFAHGLDANVTVLFVRPPSLTENSIDKLPGLKRMGSWDPKIPGVEYLQRAKQILAGAGLSDISAVGEKRVRHAFRESDEGGIELYLAGRQSGRIRLKLREGETAEEIIEEISQGQYDLVIVGPRGHHGTASYFVGSTALRIAQFSPSSVLITKNIKKMDRFLICTDGSQSAQKAELLGTEAAQALHAKVTVLHVVPEPGEEPSAREQVRRAEMILAQSGMEAPINIRIGRPSEVIIDEAKNHDVVVMGASGGSAVKRFFLGSVPLKVIEYGERPVLLVREKPQDKI